MAVAGGIAPVPLKMTGLLVVSDLFRPESAIVLTSYEQSVRIRANKARLLLHVSKESMRVPLVECPLDDGKNCADEEEVYERYMEVSRRVTKTRSLNAR